MDYKIFEDKIEVYNLQSFDIKHICECGQLFRYEKNNDGSYFVVSGKFRAKVAKIGEKCVIWSDNPTYFANFFDLDYDYNKAKKELGKNKLMANSIRHGEGIRIAKADKFEIIVEFIISANNNIKRIKKIVEKLCGIGDKKADEFGEYNAFPSAAVLAIQSDEWYASLGAGYRAPYLKQTAQFLCNTDLDAIGKLSSPELYKWLLSLKGVGPKVASCIMLFGFGRKEFFPVDTWLEQVYYNHFDNGKKTRKQIQEYFENMFGEYSGLAQQYLFYAERDE